MSRPLGLKVPTSRQQTVESFKSRKCSSVHYFLWLLDRCFHHVHALTQIMPYFCSRWLCYIIIFHANFSFHLNRRFFNFLYTRSEAASIHRKAIHWKGRGGEAEEDYLETLFCAVNKPLPPHISLQYSLHRFDFWLERGIRNFYLVYSYCIFIHLIFL